MIILGYILAIAIGVTLGLIGAGGSILTVPILVYLFGVKPVMATSYSLLLVGSAALVGAVRYWQQGVVNFRVALMFVCPSMTAMLATRIFILPAIPDPLIGVPKDIFIMLLFATLMMVAASFMLKSVKVNPDRSSVSMLGRMLKLTIGSASVGFLSGMVGAGGGFLIIPTLIALFDLSMKEAVGTSLVVIAINSLIGFQGDMLAGIPLDWSLLKTILGLVLFGMWVGTTLSMRIEGEKLKKLFGVFTLLVGFAVLTEELHALLIT